MDWKNIDVVTVVKLFVLSSEKVCKVVDRDSFSVVVGFPVVV